MLDKHVLSFHVEGFPAACAILMMQNYKKWESIFIFLKWIQGQLYTSIMQWVCALFITAIICVIWHTCQVTLDISGSPIDFQWGSQKYPG